MPSGAVPFNKGPVTKEVSRIPEVLFRIVYDYRYKNSNVGLKVIKCSVLRVG